MGYLRDLGDNICLGIAVIILLILIWSTDEELSPYNW